MISERFKVLSRIYYPELLPSLCAVMVCACFSRALAADISPGSNVTEKPGTAMQDLLRMADYVSNLQHFTYVVNGGYDVVQKDGQKIEFLESRKIAVSRPDHVRGDFVQSDGSEGVVTFDGKRISLYNKTEQVAGTTETVGTIDDAVKTLSGRLGVRMPLAMMLSPNLGTTLREKVKSADVVGTTSLGGVVCKQLAARGEKVDLQVWVQEGDQPLPRRVIITYRDEKGMPQYRADLTEWKVLSTRDNELVTFHIPEGTEQLEFHPVKNASTHNAAQKDANP